MEVQTQPIPQPKLRLTPEFQACIEAWKWSKPLPLDVWAEQRRILPEGSPFPGPWSNSTFPYLTAILKAITDPNIREVVIWAGSQSGKTEILLNLIGWIIDQNPAPTLVYYPNERSARQFVETRLEPMMRSCPTLKAKYEFGSRRKYRKTMLSHSYPGMTLELLGSNSPASFRQRPAKFVLADEIDSFPLDVGEEGDPISLLRNRAQNYYNHKIVLVSTCTIAGQSKIEREYYSSLCHQYFIPCLQCGEYQTLSFDRLNFDSEKDAGLAATKTRYECSNCNHQHYENDKRRMLALGRWQQVEIKQDDGSAPQYKDGAKVGFWWSSLYSPTVSWGQIVAEYRQAEGNIALHRTHLNTRLAKTWKERVQRTTIDTLLDCIDDHPTDPAQRRVKGQIPKDILALTCGIDVQGDRVYYSVWGWGIEGRSYLIDAGLIPRPADNKRLDFLDSLLNKQWVSQDNRTFRIAYTFIDSGYDTTAVYDYCRTRRFVSPSKGSSTSHQSGEPVRAFKTDKSIIGYWVDTAFFKDNLTVGINTARGEPYELRLYSGIDKAFLQHMSSEHKVMTRSPNGAQKWKWEMVSEERENHWWDTAVYAAAAAWLPVRVQSMRLAPPPQKEEAEKPKKPVQQYKALAGVSPIRSKY